MGRPVHPSEPLIAAGVDSRAAMELRRSLGEALAAGAPAAAATAAGDAGAGATAGGGGGLSLPVTLLYDYQSVDDIVGYIEGQLQRLGQQQQQQQRGGGGGGGATAAEVRRRLPGHDADDGGYYGTDDDEDDDGEGVEEVRDARRAAAREAAATADAAEAAGSSSAAAAGPSALLKVLRPPSAPRPLFLAAPGVANAQSAYFSFSAFLQWADQPIYVLDKDNDLDIDRCAETRAGEGEESG